jgi:hypothetical protein
LRKLPFNLAEALAGKPVVNGRGESVVQIVLYPTIYTSYKVYGLVKSKDGDEVNIYTVDGNCPTSTEEDLYMVDPVVECTGYVNIWQNGDLFSPAYSNVHYSLEQAEAERISSCSNKQKILLARLPFQYLFNPDTKEIKINA